MSKTILLIGERAVDRYIIGHCPKLAQEAPVPVFIPRTEKSNHGMAANVLANLNSLAPDWNVHYYGPSSAPIEKIRYIDEMSGQQIVRMDIGDDEVQPMSLVPFMEVLKRQAATGTKYDAVVFSEYGKDFLSTSDMAAIAKWAKDSGIPIFADTKHLVDEWAADITVVKINRKEADAHDGDLYPYCENLIVTEGGGGSYLRRRESPDDVLRVPVESVDVRSVAGAGDSYLAGLVVSYLEQGSGWKEISPLVHEGPGIIEYDQERLLKAMQFANKVARIAVSKPGVVAVKREEVV